MNIFAPTPKIYPSLLNSIAGEAIEFANPVIGTAEPAPANLANLSKIPKPVNKIVIKINIKEVHVLDSSNPIFLLNKKLLIN